MNHTILDVGKTVLIGWCSNVTVSIPVSLQNAIDCCQENETSNIKLTILNPSINKFLQETIFYVFLENNSFLKMFIIFT